MRVMLRVRKPGEAKATDYPLDSAYSLTEVQQIVDNAITKRVEVTVLPEGGGDALAFDVRTCEIISVSDADFKFPKRK